MLEQAIPYFESFPRGGRVGATGAGDFVGCLLPPTFLDVPFPAGDGGIGVSTVASIVCPGPSGCWLIGTACAPFSGCSGGRSLTLTVTLAGFSSFTAFTLMWYWPGG